MKIWVLLLAAAVGGLLACSIIGYRIGYGTVQRVAIVINNKEYVNAFLKKGWRVKSVTTESKEYWPVAYFVLEKFGTDDSAEIEKLLSEQALQEAAKRKL